MKKLDNSELEPNGFLNCRGWISLVHRMINFLGRRRSSRRGIGDASSSTYSET